MESAFGIALVVFLKVDLPANSNTSALLSSESQSSGPISFHSRRCSLLSFDQSVAHRRVCLV